MAVNLNRSRDKIRNDEYYTTEGVVKVILPYLKPKSTVWCCADKEESNYVKVLREQGHKVIYTHIETGEDFLTYEPDFEFDYIITNPPYSIRKQFYIKVLEYNKPYALLLPLVSLALKDIRLNSKDLQLLHFMKRPSFIRPEGSELGKPPSEISYFCKGLEIPSSHVVVKEVK